MLTFLIVEYFLVRDAVYALYFLNYRKDPVVDPEMDLITWNLILENQLIDR